MKTKILGILVMTLLIATAFSVNGCVELNDIKSNISIDKGIASSSTTADYKSFFNGHKEGESNILNKDGNWQWAKGAGGAYYDVGAAIVTLSDGSTIVTGFFSDSATFGPGESCESVLVSDGSYDIFLAKYNPDGTLAWVKRAGGTSEDVGRGLVLLSDGSTIVTGSFSGSATWGKGESCETVLVSDGSNDIFVAKYNPVGLIMWVKRAGGTSEDVGRGLVLLSDGSTIVTGSFSDSATFGPGESCETVLVSDGSNDIFLAKHNWDGTLAWVKRAGGTSKDVGRGLVLLSDDSTIVTGSFSDSATWGKGESCETVLVSDGSDDIFVAKYNPDGTLAWVKRAGGTSEDVGRGLVLLSDGSTIVTGSFSDSATWGKGESCETVLVSDGSNDIFVAKYNPVGLIMWVKRAGGELEDVGRGLVLLSDGSTIVTGSFSDSATWGKGESCETVLVSDGSDDIFVAKYNPVGLIMWVKRAGGTDYDFGNGVSVDGSENIYITGTFEGIANFGPYILTCQSERDNNDIFVAKLSDDGVNQPPNKPSTPSGPANGDAGTTYTYTSSATDPDGDSISYLFEWGDDTDSGWTDPIPSGQTATETHKWSDQGTYQIKVKARDVPDLDESEWSDPLSISMPKNKPYINTPFLNFLEQHPHLFSLLRQLLGL